MKIIAANWKMNTIPQEGLVLAEDLAQIENVEYDVVIFPPHTHISILAYALEESSIMVGAQDCHYETNGAFTGDVSAAMLEACDCTHVILGHSERRQYHNETDEIVRKKAQQALKYYILPIICVGESKDERDSGKYLDKILKQVEQSTPNRGDYIIAYEPVWAIGSGITPSPEEIDEVHSAIKDNHGDHQIIYGGSVNEVNYKEIINQENVDGLLVGSASTSIEKFSKIITNS